VTFDPLEIKNAHLNIHKLGAIVRSYYVNFYGVSSSRLQGGLPTDRLVAEWYLDSDRVSGILEDRPAATYEIEERILVQPHLPVEGFPGGRSKQLPFSCRTATSFKSIFQRISRRLLCQGRGR